MLKARPLISIITATFNSEGTILDTYNSIKAQTYDNWEWLVTDDKSSDSTFEVLKDIAIVDPRVKLFKNEVNSGAAVSRNKSLSNIQGDFICFIDSDDLWKSEKLQKQLQFMGENIHFSFTAYELIDSSGDSIGQTVDTENSGMFSYEDMLRKKATMGCSTVMLRRAAFPKVCMPLIRTGQDYATWLSLLKVHNAAILNVCLTQYRILPNSISRNKFRKAKRQWQIYREIEKLSLLKSTVCFFHYAFRAIFRKK